MDLIVLESPNKVRDVERYAKACGFDVRVQATSGHLLDLPPMSAGPAIHISTFTMANQQPRDDAAAERVLRLRAAIATADRVIVATDPDREGEAIGAQVWPWIPPGRAWRATFEEITRAGVERGLREMRPFLAMMAVEAAHTRRVIDRLAGWHGTALVFDKLRHHKGLSAGRLQSAALRLVVERHREHEAFRASTSYGVRVTLRTSTGALVVAKAVDERGVPRSFSTEAEARAVTVSGEVRVASVDADRREQRPRPPFEASSWLQVACKTLGISVREATQATQVLFESGRTTYPRTDAVRVAEEAITWARQEIRRRFGPEYLPEEPWRHGDTADATVQGAHEAIRPTIPHGQPGEVDSRRSGLWGDAYALIEARFLASQSAARVVEQTTIAFSSGGVRLVARGQVELFDGWRRMLETDAFEEPDQAGAFRSDDDEGDLVGQLAAVAPGDTLLVVAQEVTTHVTKPKALFTQAALVAELKRLGIGRPSTYHTIVPLLMSRGWVIEMAPKRRRAGSKAKAVPSLSSTTAGQDLCAFLVEALPGLVDYAFTASMEKALDDVERGARTRLEVARDWWSHFERELSVARTFKPRSLERKDLGPCPKCAAAGRSGRLRLIEGTNVHTKEPYQFAGCDADTKQDRVCGHKAQVADGQLLASPPCPHCRADLRAVTRKDGGRSWLCQEHGWFLAGRRWELVRAPTCQHCSNHMIHRERRAPKGEFFWACFAHGAFLGSDRFGSVSKR